MRAVIYQHEAHEEPGLLEPALVAAGFELTRRFRSVSHHEDVEAALLVVLGGSMSVRAEDRHPFLREERAVLAARRAADAPCLGICLGAQLLAAVAGAEVFAGKNGIELGVAPVRWTKAAQVDPAFAGVPARSMVAHWHEDTFDAVPGATLLASTDRYTQQAFRLGRSIGLQFHLELTAQTFRAWLTQAPEELALHGKDLHELEAQLPKLAAAEAASAELLARIAFSLARRD